MPQEAEEWGADGSIGQAEGLDLILGHWGAMAGLELERVTPTLLWGRPLPPALVAVKRGAAGAGAGKGQAMQVRRWPRLGLRWARTRPRGAAVRQEDTGAAGAWGTPRSDIQGPHPCGLGVGPRWATSQLGVWGPVTRPECFGVETLYSLGQGVLYSDGEGESTPTSLGGQGRVPSPRNLAPPRLVAAKRRVATHLWTPSSFQPARPVRTHPAPSRNPPVSPLPPTLEAPRDPWRLDCPA